MAVMKDIERAIVERFGEGFVVTPVTNDKGNGVVRKGVAIKREGASVGMCVYFDDIAKSVESEEATIAEIAENAWETFKKQEPEMSGIDLSGLNKEKILADVQFALKYEPGNKEWLDGLMKRSFLNMAITYIYPVNDVGTIKITKAIARALEITENELFESAKINGMFKEKWCVKELGSLICEMLEIGVFTDDEVETMAEGDPQMLVLTNKHGFNGAAVLLQESILKKVSRIYGEKDFLIIPSSIHECIATPADGVDENDIKDMNRMVYEVNTTQVEPNEWLGFNVFRYNAKTQEVSIA